MTRPSRNQKRLQELARREAAFRARLLPRLRDCEAGFGTLLFLVDDHAAAPLPRYVRDPDADELLADASWIVAERSALVLAGGSLAARYVAACAEAAASDDEQRLGPRRLARELLHWLERSGRPHGLQVGGQSG